MILKPLLTLILSFLIVPFSFSQELIKLPIDFPLDLIQANLGLLQTIFNNPENSFNVITDPVQRLKFLQEMTSSLDSLSQSLSVVDFQSDFDLDIPFINVINIEIESMMNEISTRASQYILPLNVSELVINQNFVIYRLNSSISNWIKKDFEIYLPQVLTTLNESLYDLSLQINIGSNQDPYSQSSYLFDRYPSTDILASYDILLIKLSDLENFLVQNDITIILKINPDICYSISDCNLYCGIWDENWNVFPAKIFNTNQISCKISNLSLKSIGNNQAVFSPIGVFKVDNVDSKELSDQFIIFIVLSVIVFFILSFYFVKKYINKKIKLSSTYQSTPNYHSVV